MNILFVCLSNLRRSALAAAAMQEIYTRRGLTGRVESAALVDWHVGKPADLRAIQVAQSHGLDLRGHRARQITEDDFFQFDRILAMDRDNERALHSIAPATAQHKISGLRAAARDEHGYDTFDPCDGSMADFEALYGVIVQCCESVAGEITPGIRLEPLSNETFEGAASLIDRVFEKQDLLHHPLVAFKLSIHNEGRLAKLAQRLTGLVRPCYWVAIDQSTGHVVGVTGKYESREDSAEAAWMGWSCVHPAYRGRGLGRALVSYVIDSIRREGKTVCRAYTSDHPIEKPAQALYDSLGLRVVRTENERGAERKYYREVRFA